MIIDGVREFIARCPFLKNQNICANYLGEKPVRYTIDNVSAEPILKRYTDGGTQRQFIFDFASRESYDAEQMNGFQVSGFYEKFADWIERQNDAGVLPELGEGSFAQRIETVSSGHLAQNGDGGARFQIRCRLIYYKGV